VLRRRTGPELPELELPELVADEWLLEAETVLEREERLLEAETVFERAGICLRGDT